MAERLPDQPVAAIDCGTNAIRLLVACVDAQGVLHELRRELRIVRLGEGVDATGSFSAVALERTFDACAEYAEIIAGFDAHRLRFVATSASRDVSNRDDFVAGVQDRLDVLPEVISGSEEAELSFLGAVRGLSDIPARPVLVVDIGGGSTEFILGVDSGRLVGPDRSISVDIGCVRMTERHLHDDPPTVEQVHRVEQDVAAALDLVQSRVSISEAASMVGLAGTVTTMAAMALGLDAYDPARIHGSTLTALQVDQVSESLVRMTRAERARLPFMHPGRVDVIAGGALILREIVHRSGVSEVIVSECDLLDGIVHQLAAPTDSSLQKGTRGNL